MPKPRLKLIRILGNAVWSEKPMWTINFVHPAPRFEILVCDNQSVLKWHCSNVPKEVQFRQQKPKHREVTIVMLEIDNGDTCSSSILGAVRNHKRLVQIQDWCCAYCSVWSLSSGISAIESIDLRFGLNFEPLYPRQICLDSKNHDFYHPVLMSVAHCTTALGPPGGLRRQLAKNFVLLLSVNFHAGFSEKSR